MGEAAATPKSLMNRKKDAPLEVRIKSVPTYRIKKIEVQTREEVSEIKFTYDDDTIWSCGQSGGTKDKRVIVMTEGEYLVRVCHERLYNYRSAGASVEFETNKGRVFTYKPGKGWRGLATGWKDEMTTIIAENDMEIISLVIRRGILIGSEQQALPQKELADTTCQSNTKKPWFVYVQTSPKEDGNLNVKDEDEKNEDFVYQHFHSKSEALKVWKSAANFLDAKKARAGCLIDCIKIKIMKSRGDQASIENCIQDATDKGFYTPVRDEEVSMLHVLWTLYKCTISRNELLLFFLGLLTTFVTDYLSVHGQLIKGEMLAFLVSDNLDVLQRKSILSTICSRLLTCDTTDKISMCKVILISALLLKLVEVLFAMINIYINEVLNASKRLSLDHEILTHVIQLDHTFFDTHSYSHISNSMNLRSIYRMVSYQIPNLISSAIRFFITLYYLLVIDVYLGGFCALLTIIATLGILNRVLQKMQIARKYEWKWDRAFSGVRAKVLSNLTIIKYFSNEEQHLTESDSIKDECVNSLKFNVYYQCLCRLTFGMMNLSIFGGCIYLTLHYLQHSGITTGQITGFFFLLREFQSLTQSIIRNEEWLRGSFRDLDRYVRLKDEKAKLESGDVVVDDLQGDIVFKDVNFSYPSRPMEKVLKGLDMTIQPNKMTAIVGESGAGKSTIAKLLMRLYDPHSGTITIDGHDLKSLNTKKLHEQMTIVEQNPKLFGATLAENIGYGAINNQYTDKELKDAADLANCGFIEEKFRAGFDTYTGSSETQLSGGQKQRIAIARAAIRNPKILILDEATSSLDAENEKEVQEALEKVMKGRTIVVIAHRLSTIKNADNIICMKDGQLAEQGTHDELMELQGVYHNLISKQIENTSSPKEKKKRKDD